MSKEVQWSHRHIFLFDPHYITNLYKNLPIYSFMVWGIFKTNQFLAFHARILIKYIILKIINKYIIYHF